MAPMNAVIPLPYAEHSLARRGRSSYKTTFVYGRPLLNDPFEIDLGFKVSLSNDYCKSLLGVELATGMWIPDHALQSRLNQVFIYTVKDG
jgi:hypothetical protein